LVIRAGPGRPRACDESRQWPAGPVATDDLVELSEPGLRNSRRSWDRQYPG